MSKNQKHHAKSQEFEKEQIRNLKKQLRRKDQEIRRLEKELGFNQNQTKELAKALKETADLYKCPDCGKGCLQTVDFGIRKVTTCSLCTYRKTSK